MKDKIKIRMIVLLILLSSTTAFADSLWVAQETGQVESLYSDHKAAKVGDIVTVLIIEAATASQKAVSARDRKSSIAGEVKDWSTIDFYHGPRTKIAGANKPIWEIETANKFSGGGSYSGNYNIRGQISTRIVEVLPNKNMVIEGSSEVLINRERNTIVISGIVRPQDITVNNTVLSTQVADAKIRIVGKGPLHDKTGRGLLETLLDWFWPF